jgi:predicted nucleotidyltransferase
MNLSEPMSSVVPGVQGAVLAALARSPEALTGRALTARLKRPSSHVGVNDALSRLVVAGLVDRVDKGRAALYSLNRDHVAADAIALLADLREATLHRMATTIEGWTERPVSATVFGSFARGDGDDASDVDLLLVRRDDAVEDVWRDQVGALTRDVRRWTGNPIGVIDFTEPALLDAANAGESVIESASAEGRTIVGTSLRRLVAAGRRRR